MRFFHDCLSVLEGVLDLFAGLLQITFCLICLAFLFFESVFGICLGCKFYPLFFKKKPQLCPGEVCERRSKQAIQKVSAAQLVVLVVFVAIVVFAARLFNDQFSKQAHYLFEDRTTAKTK